MASKTVRLLVECCNLAQVLRSIETAAKAWFDNAPATRLVDKIKLEGSVQNLARKIELQVCTQAGGWQTQLTRTSGMSIIITQNADSTLQIVFAGERVSEFRNTFLQSVIEYTRHILVNDKEYPAPQMMI